MRYCPQCKQELISKFIEDSDRLACPDDGCGFVFWNNPVPVVAALVKHQGRYVIARNKKWPEGILSFITGFLESGESPEEGVVREVKEELGLDAEVVHFLGLHTHTQANQLLIAFELDATGQLVTNDELAEIRQLTPDELARYDFGPLYITKQAIQRWRELHPELDS